MTIALDIHTHGIILGTRRFEACVGFYRDTIGLPVWFEKPGIVCFRFGNGYLMVETEEVASDFMKDRSGGPMMLRFNVNDVLASAEKLRKNGVAVDVKIFEWGTVGTFTDPDGNACELKNADDSFFS